MTDQALIERVRLLGDAIVAEALIATDYAPIFGSLCERLYAAGVPVWRVHSSTTTLNPLAEGLSLTWTQERGVLTQYYVHGSSQQDRWLRSPLAVMLESNQSNIRIRGDQIAEAARDYPIIAELETDGLSDYFAMVLPFSDPETAIERRDGVIVSFATNRPGGFDPAHIEALDGLMPRFGLVAKLANREGWFFNILDAYLGPDAGKRVRDGQIALGSGDLTDAVIWFCDLRNSVTLAETLGHAGFIDLLNDYFEALAGSVIEEGGQVLRFIGDAALAIFPISEGTSSEHDAKQLALKAVRRAVTRAAAINQGRAQRGLETFRFGIGLHVGRILFGNIGVPSRVEFSVIGPAANETARIEGLCKKTNQVVLVSEAFRSGLEHPWQDLGLFPIRGSGEMRLYAPRDKTS